jgi:hypothetical protein
MVCYSRYDYNNFLTNISQVRGFGKVLYAAVNSHVHLKKRNPEIEN